MTSACNEVKVDNFSQKMNVFCKKLCNKEVDVQAAGYGDEVH